MIITIDGPAGAGKSTVARQLAAKLGFDYLDTGAMYRAVALAGIDRHVDWNHPSELVAIAKRLPIRAEAGRTFVGDDDVTDAVRSAEVTEKTHFAADNPDIREIMVQAQREQTIGKNVVTEGRDQGTAVFPNAECKIFLTATPEERARRRVREYEQQDEQRGVQASANFHEILERINQRDARDMARTVGPLCEPPDAVRVVTDGMSVDDVVARLIEIVRKRTRVL